MSMRRGSCRQPHAMVSSSRRPRAGWPLANSDSRLAAPPVAAALPALPRCAAGLRMRLSGSPSHPYHLHGCSSCRRSFCCAAARVAAVAACWAAAAAAACACAAAAAPRPTPNSLGFLAAGTDTATSGSPRRFIMRSGDYCALKKLQMPPAGGVITVPQHNHDRKGALGRTRQQRPPPRLCSCNLRKWAIAQVRVVVLGRRLRGLRLMS